MNCLTEYDEEATMRAFRKEGYEDGRADGYTEGRTNGLAEGERKKAVEAAVMLISDFNVEPQLAAEKMNAPLDFASWMAAKVSAVSPDCEMAMTTSSLLITGLR